MFAVFVEYTFCTWNYLLTTLVSFKNVFIVLFLFYFVNTLFTFISCAFVVLPAFMSV